MKVAFRTDASSQIGSGHVMRCLTLAHTLSHAGHECVFICRNMLDDYNQHIQRAGFRVYALDADSSFHQTQAEPLPRHHAWLQTSWQHDAEQTRTLIEAMTPDRLVVDHYALDARWEQAVTQGDIGCMVIDDLADRPHQCDLLLDQNIVRSYADYDGLLPADCVRLIGPDYLLLRPDFAAHRAKSIARRAHAPIRHLLLCMGGYDQHHLSLEIVRVMQQMTPLDGIYVTVMTGQNEKLYHEIEAFSQTSPFAMRPLAFCEDMASLLTEVDLAITASGFISYELLSLAVPAILCPVSEVQAQVAAYLANIEGIIALKQSPPLPAKALCGALSYMFNAQPRLSDRRVDGLGANRVVDALIG